MSGKSSTQRCLSNVIVKVSRNCGERTLNITVLNYFQNALSKINYHNSGNGEKQNGEITLPNLNIFLCKTIRFETLYIETKVK